MQLPGALLGPSSKKEKKPPPKKFLVFREMEPSSSNIKQFLTFYETKTQKNSLYFREMKFSISNIFSKENFLIFSENKIPKKLLLFSQEKAFPFFRKLKP